MNEVESTVHHHPLVSFWNDEISNSDFSTIYRQRPYQTGIAEGEKKRYQFSLNEEQYARILNFVNGNGVGVFNCILGSFGILFSRYSFQKVFFFDSPCLNIPAGSARDGAVVPLCCYLDESWSLREYLKSVLRNTSDCDTYQHQRTEQQTDKKVPDANIYIQYSDIHGEFLFPEKYDLSINIEPSERGVDITLEYSVKYFEDHFIESIKEHLETVLSYFNKLDILITNIDILSAREQALLNSFNPAPRTRPDKTMVRLFEEQVMLHPDTPAIVSNDGNYSYIQLKKESDKLAAYLIEQGGVLRGDVVAVMTDRSSRCIVSMLAVLKAGAAYLPIDPVAPVARKQYMLEQTEAKMLLTDSAYMFDLTYYSGTLFALDLQLAGLTESTSYADVSNAIDDVAYVIYTSGSTGHPKGVMIQHEALVNLCYWHIENFKLSQKSRATLFANISFDAFTWELWPYLLSGGCVYPVAEEQKLNLQDLEALLKVHSITHCFLPTPICEEYLKQKRSLPNSIYLLTGGDELKQATTRDINLVNNYGPTEATVVATSCSLINNIHDPIIPIGKPIDNTQLFILDKELRKVPVGVEGELFIAGSGLAKGYIAENDLTEDKFIVNPFAENRTDRMYKTGDCAVWLKDGHVLFRGRKDNQVKIRGYRIELGEIEAYIKQTGIVEDVKVLASIRPDMDKHLIAYCLTQEPVSIESLKTTLTTRLPAYMVPVNYVVLKSFPLTANGKIDNATLLNLLPEVTKESTKLPVDESIMKMIHIWKEVLSAESLGADDNFFNCGGDSIKAIRLIYDVNNAYGSKLKLMDIFKFDTPRLLMGRIEEPESTEGENSLLLEVEQYLKECADEYLAAHSDVTGIQDVFPVADIQLGMLYHGLFGEDGATYHDQIVHQVKYVDFTPALVMSALELMMKRHGILRTAFDLSDNGNSRQLVYDTASVDYMHSDLSGLTRKEQQDSINAFLVKDRKYPFKIENPGLWRVRTFNLGNDRVVIILICHHAIIDGWSDATFSTELNNTYRKLKEDGSFIPKSIDCTYKDYVRDELVTKRNPTVKKYWTKTLNGFRKTKFTFDLNDEESTHKIHNEALGLDLKEKLHQFSSKHNISPRVVCFTVYLSVIKLLSVEEDLIVGLHTHNRPLHKDSDKMLGCFLNTVPARYEFVQSRTGLEHLNDINKLVLDLAEYGSLSLMEIAQLFPHQGNSASENIFFDSLFAYLDFHVYRNLEYAGGEFSDTFALNELDIPGQGINNTHFNFLLNSTLQEFNLLISYKSLQINDEFIATIGKLFKDNLTQLLENPGEAIQARQLEQKEVSTNALYSGIEFNL